MGGGAVTLTGGEEKLKRACRFSHASADESPGAGDVNLSSVLMCFCKFMAYSHARGAAGQNTLDTLRHKLIAARKADGVKMPLAPPCQFLPWKKCFIVRSFFSEILVADV